MKKSGFRPWNKDRVVGPRQALARGEVQQVYTALGQLERWHDQCLFAVAIDTMLRASDLLELRVCDLTNSDGAVIEHFHVRQKKTGNGVAPVLTDKTLAAVSHWLEISGKGNDDFLFTCRKSRSDERISIGYYRALVKQWVELIGLRPDRYSSHSLRRTKPKFLFANGVPIETIALLLGHRSSISTMRYLGLDQDVAHEAALAHDILG